MIPGLTSIIAACRNPLVTLALGLVIGSGGMMWSLADRVATREALIVSDANLKEERRTSAALRATIEIERTKRQAALAGIEAVERVREETAARATALEDLIDEYENAAGGDAPASDLLLDAIGVLRSE